MYSKACLIAALFLLIMPASISAQTFTLANSPTGIQFATNGGNRLEGSFGTVNGLGIGTAAAGVTVIPLNNGALYLTTYHITVSGLPGNPHLAHITGFINQAFTHPAALILESCPSSASCTSASDFSVVSNNSAAPTTIVNSMDNGTVTVGLGIFVPDNDGASAFTGSDNVRMTLTATDTQNNHVIGSTDIRLDQPQGVTLQNAVRLTLGTAPGGLNVNPAGGVTVDYTMNFGNVNGLGIGPAAGLTTVAAANGIIYSTPYLLQPVFTDFTSTTATIKVILSSDFAHPAILSPQDADSSGGPYTQIIKTTPTQITATAADRSSITRYLGLFVSNTSGAGAFTGSDNATLTFTMTVP